MCVCVCFFYTKNCRKLDVHSDSFPTKKWTLFWSKIGIMEAGDHVTNQIATPKRNMEAIWKPYEYWNTIW